MVKMISILLKMARNNSNVAPLYKPQRYVPPYRVGFFALFWSENGYTVYLFWSGIGYGFRGNYGVRYERKKERKI